MGSGKKTRQPPKTYDQPEIYSIRGLPVVLDSALANIYGVPTGKFNQAVKRNIKRFPDEFAFQLTQEEFRNLISQSVTSSGHGAFHPLKGLCFEVVDQVDTRLHLSVRSGAIPVPHPG